MRSSVLEFIHQRKNYYTTCWKEDIGRRLLTDSQQSDELVDELKNEIIDIVFEALYTETHSQDEQLRRFTERVIHYGLPLVEFIRGLQLFRQMIKADMSVSHYTDEDIRTFEEWLDELISKLVDESAKIKEHVIDLQNNALKELSAPVIPVFDGISIIPLIGSIDTERAKQIMENLLESVIEHRAQVVLIDITGVPVVDTMVAQHIINVYEAVRLVGSECLVVGIRPEIAQTIVNLGIDLRKFSTTSTLQKGVETALDMTHREIRKTPRV